MQVNLRKSLDEALNIEKLLKIKTQVLGNILLTESDLEDALVLFIAHAINRTTEEREQLNVWIKSIIEQIDLFGEVGFEKELAFVPEE